MPGQTVCIELQTGPQTACVQDSCPHELVPQQCCPVIGTRRESILIDQAIVAGSERIVEDGLNCTFRKPAKLVQVAKAVQKSGSRGIAPACRIGRLGNPYRFTRLETIMQAQIKTMDLTGACQPFV